MHRRIFPRASFARSGGALLAAVLVLAAPVLAQNEGGAPVTLSLYSGEPGSLTLSGWGSGKAEANTESVLVGSQSIKVTTQGLYQGALLSLAQPVDLRPALANRNTYLRMQVRFVPGGANAAPTGEETFDPSTGETRRTASSPFERMRFVVTMADNTRYEMIRPVEVQGTDDPDSWVYIAFPIEAIFHKSPAAVPAASGAPASGTPAAPTVLPTGDGAKLSQLALFGDRYQQFFIGDISVITDDTDITVDSLEEQVAFVGDALVFAGAAEGGASTLHYSWDLDGDKKEDRQGRTIQHFWRKPGKYTVTLTVSDVDGLKKAASTSVTIDVSQ